MSGVTVHSVEITALTARAELMSVLRAAAVIVFVASAYLALPGRVSRGAGRGAAALLPYQALAATLDTADQRLFRALQVALIEAQNLRLLEEAWPDAAAMAAEGIEPFSPDPTNRGARYTWLTAIDDGTISYLGLPDQSGAPAWLARIQEPEPLAPPEPFQNDEEHARLPDGTLLHVGIWRHAGGSRAGRAVPRVPQAEGWIQVFAVGPSSLH